MNFQFNLAIHFVPTNSKLAYQMTKPPSNQISSNLVGFASPNSKA